MPANILVDVGKYTSAAITVPVINNDMAILLSINLPTPLFLFYKLETISFVSFIFFLSNFP